MAFQRLLGALQRGSRESNWVLRGDVNGVPLWDPKMTEGTIIKRQGLNIYATGEEWEGAHKEGPIEGPWV